MLIIWRIDGTVFARYNFRAVNNQKTHKETEQNELQRELSALAE